MTTATQQATASIMASLRSMTTDQMLSLGLSMKNRELAEGRWRLEVVASLSILAANGEPLKIIPYAKYITVRALNAPLPPPQTPTESMIYHVRSAGLEITKIEPLL